MGTSDASRTPTRILTGYWKVDPSTTLGTTRQSGAWNSAPTPGTTLLASSTAPSASAPTRDPPAPARRTSATSSAPGTPPRGCAAGSGTSTSSARWSTSRTPRTSATTSTTRGGSRTSSTAKSPNYEDDQRRYSDVLHFLNQ